MHEWEDLENKGGRVGGLLHGGGYTPMGLQDRLRLRDPDCGGDVEEIGPAVARMRERGV